MGPWVVWGKEGVHKGSPFEGPTKGPCSYPKKKTVPQHHSRLRVHVVFNP